MKFILEYRIWDLFKKKKNINSEIDWKKITSNLIDYYIKNDIPIQIKESFGWEPFPYNLKTGFTSNKIIYALWSDYEGEPPCSDTEPKIGFNLSNGLDENMHWKIEVQIPTRGQFGVVYICTDTTRWARDFVDGKENFDLKIVSQESFDRVKSLFKNQLYKWDIFHSISSSIRIFDSRYNLIDDGIEFWDRMSKLNEDYSFFKYPNIINWHRYVDCVITESSITNPPDKNDDHFEVTKLLLNKKGFKVI